ncbi:MAG: oligopeptide/dipeptide ABC transporter ATP-binding protein [Candidatus Izemoplasmatales bacterium]|nr:ATP-binding cassette domain-containing protein [bacterium]MDZ4195925.1 oligopeptide/dipeptide ABC transporter ATP-binding protein [Candidatus Izemoplasmatales bacterium]
MDKQVPLLEVKNLKKYFVSGSGKHIKVLKAVDGINFHIYKGETFGLVGESGCGKTTTGRTVIGLYNLTDGEVFYNGKRISIGQVQYRREHKELKDELKTLKALYQKRIKESRKAHSAISEPSIKEELTHRLQEIDLEYVTSKAEILLRVLELKQTRVREKSMKQKMQMIFQDPYASLNTRMTVSDIVSEGIKTHNLYDSEDAQAIVVELLAKVGLKQDHANRYPHEFSGGQRQRIGIARALAVQPELIICDEPISALDVSIQAQVINMLEDLQNEFGLTYLFIAHDLSMVRHISDRIGVMYLGKMMEVAKSEELYETPLHPYTQSLLSSIPVPDPHNNMQSKRIILKGDVLSPINPKPGCRFATRCRFAKEECHSITPILREVKKEHEVACHFVEEINGI